MKKLFTSAAVLLLFVWIPQQVGASTTDAKPAANPQHQSTEEQWGIQPVALRPTMGGGMLDFRYRVVDAKKAAPLFDLAIKPYLFDPAVGAALGMRYDSKLGALRASVRNPPVNGKQYYVLFANGQGHVRKGDKVNVVIGDCTLKDIVVE